MTQTAIPLRRLWPLLVLLLAILVFGRTQAAPTAAPLFSQHFSPATIGPGSTTRLTFTVDSTSVGNVSSDLEFSNTLPAAITIAQVPNATTNCTSGVIDAPAGGSTITFSKARIGTGQSCTVEVNVTAAIVGTHTSTSGDLTSTTGNSGTSSDDLTVATNRPGFSKTFSTGTIKRGERSTLTFTIDNTANTSALSSLTFSDDLPGGLTIADPANASSDCGGTTTTLTATAGDNQISFSSWGFLFPGYEALQAGASCTVSLDVVAVGVGNQANQSSDLMSNVGSSGFATDDLEVTVQTIDLTKLFIDNRVAPNETTTLRFTLENFDRGRTAQSINFTDDLNAMLSGTVALAPLPSNPCGVGSSLSGSSTLALSDGTLLAGDSCTFDVTVQVPAVAAAGSYVNTTSNVSVDLAGSVQSFDPANTTLFVAPAPLLKHRVSTSPVGAGDTIFIEYTITNTSMSSSATDIAFSESFPTALQTATTIPGADACGVGSTSTFTALSNQPSATSLTPASFTLSGGTLAPAGMAGDSCTFSLTLNVESDAAATLYPLETSTISAEVDGETHEGDASSAEFAIVEPPAFLMEFTDDPVQPGGIATLVFTIADSSTLVPDLDHASPFDFTNISFTNDLDAALAGLYATNLPLTDPCGTGSTLTGSAGNTLLTFSNGTVPLDTNCTFNVTVQLPYPALPGRHTNTSSGLIANAGGIPVVGSPASDDLEVAGLDISMSFSDDPVIAGETVTLRFDITNTSSTLDAMSISFQNNLSDILGTPNVSLITALPINVCNGTLSLSGSDVLDFSGSLPVGSSCRIEVTLQVPAGAASGAYANTTSTPTALFSGNPVGIDAATAALNIDNDHLEISAAFGENTVRAGETIALAFTITNTHPTQTAYDIAFSNDLDSVLTGLAATGLAINNVCGTGSQINGTGLLSLTGGTLAAGASCTFSVQVQVPASAPNGIVESETSDVVGTISGLPVRGDMARDSVTIALVEFARTLLTTGSLVPGDSVIIQYTITNTAAVGSGDKLTDLAFTDSLSNTVSGLTAIDTPRNQVCENGSQLNGSDPLRLTGGSVDASASCTFTATLQLPDDITGVSFVGPVLTLTSGGDPVGFSTPLELRIEPAPTFTMAFAPTAINTLETSTLTFTIDNSASAIAASSLTFTNTLTTGLVIATPANAATDCGGVGDASAGNSAFSFGGGTVAAGASCTVQFDVTTSVEGTYSAISGELTSSSGNSGTASAPLSADNPCTPGIFPAAVSDTDSLNLAIRCYNEATSVGSYTINFTDTITLSTATTAIDNAINGIALVIEGDGNALDGNKAQSGLTIAAATDVTLEALTIRNGNAPAENGGAIYNRGTLTVSNSSLISNTSAFDGGAIYNNNGTVIITNSMIISNSAVVNGGGIHTFIGTVSVSESTLKNNHAAISSGGAIHSNAGGITISNSELANNSAKNDGGGVYSNYGKLTVDGGIISSNVVTGTGGGIYSTNSTVVISGSQVTSNSGDKGAGIYLLAGTASVVSSHIISNTAEDAGGGIYTIDGGVTILDSRIANNSAQGDGGGVFSNGSDVQLLIARSTIENNLGTVGGVKVNGGSAEITNTTIANNAGSNVGGIRNLAALSLTNSTISGNRISDGTAGRVLRGGGNTYTGGLLSSGTLTITHSSIISNTASDVGSSDDSLVGGFQITGTATISNTLIAQNIGSHPDAQTANNCLLNDSSVAGSGNIANDATCGTFTVVTDALVAPLANNGGATNTHALLPDSPAIDAAADCSLATDQRGSTRPFDGNGDAVVACDVGAYEGGKVGPINFYISGAADVNEGDSGSVNMTFTITRSIGPNTGSVVLTLGGTATAGDDFTDKSATILFPIGVLTQEITVPVLGDRVVESTETITATLSGVVNGVILVDSASGDIFDNDDDLFISLLSADKNEGDNGTTAFTFAITRTSAASGKDIISYSSSAGSVDPADSADFGGSFPSGSIFMGTALSSTLTINVRGDTDVEADETFVLTLNSADSCRDTRCRGVTIVTAAVTATIRNDDLAVVTLSGGTSVVEGNNGTQTLTFTATLDAAIAGGFTVAYATGDGSATVANSDYASSSGLLNFTGNANETQSFTVDINGDNIVEADETLTVTLGTITSSLSESISTAGSPQIVTITNNDAASIAASESTITVTEGATGQAVSVTLGSEPVAPVTVTLAASNSQCVVTPAMLVLNASNYAAGLAYMVTANDDAIVDGTLSCTVTAAVSSDDIFYDGISLGNTAVTTYDNDNATLSIADVMVDEGIGMALVTVTSSAESAAPITATFSTNASSATAGDDYTGSSGTVTLPAGQTQVTITIPIIDDLLDEHSETFTLTLGSSGGATIGDGSSIITILDNEAAPTISAEHATVSETAGTVVVTFTLSAVSSLDVGFDVATADDTAIAPGDYISVSTRLTLTAGMTETTLTLTIKDDVIAEAGNERFLIDISNPSNAQTRAGLQLVRLRTTQVVVTIVDNDIVGISSLPASVVVSEVQAALMTITLDTLPAAAVTITLTNTNPLKCGVSPMQVVLDASNYAIGVTVVISGHADYDENDEVCFIQDTLIESEDSDYEGLNRAAGDNLNVKVDVVDIGVLAIVFSGQSAAVMSAQRVAQIVVLLLGLTGWVLIRPKTSQRL